MEILYLKNIGKKLKDEKTIKKNFGKLTDNIINVISLMTVANNLSIVPNAPPIRRHKLVGAKNRWAIDLSKNFRMIIESTSDEEDIANIKSVIIIDIEDYH